MQIFAESLTEYKRLPTLEVKIGDLFLGAGHPIRIQTMTTADTMDTEKTVAESIRCIEAGAELVRITAPSMKEAENLAHIKRELRARGYHTPLVADIHFTPNAAEIAARIVEKVRINPGNYADKKRFNFIEYTDAAYNQEIDRIRSRFLPLIKICKEYGTALRIGTNHGSLSDRIMSRYGDTPMGMVESAMEFLRIAEDENYYNIVLSMKSSNPLVMVEAYRMLVAKMNEELGHCYPLHLGVTEAGDGEDGRIKSSIGIGALLEDGIGDTIRVSLTEDAELELPVCQKIICRYKDRQHGKLPPLLVNDALRNILTTAHKRKSFAVENIGGESAPVVIADLSRKNVISPDDMIEIGYRYNASLDKWQISDTPADYIFSKGDINFQLPGTIRIIHPFAFWKSKKENDASYPLMSSDEYMHEVIDSKMIFVAFDVYKSSENHSAIIEKVKNDKRVVLVLHTANRNRVQTFRRMFVELENRGIGNPAIVCVNTESSDAEQALIDLSVDAGSVLIQGFANGIWLSANNHPLKMINSVAFGILQASRTRISKTEYISCPSCGRTLFDLQETTAKIRAVTNHLKGIKIAVMGCIVNGPGEMADADFGYVGSGPGKITLYKGKEVIKRNIPSEIAVEELIALLKQFDAWAEPASVTG